jgi:hypothetical protein
MKKRVMTPMILLLAEFCFLKMANAVLNPLKGIPVPDFNRQYDTTIL